VHCFFLLGIQFETLMETYGSLASHLTYQPKFQKIFYLQQIKMKFLDNFLLPYYFLLLYKLAVGSSDCSFDVLHSQFQKIVFKSVQFLPKVCV
jgi:hypothetical protein